MVRFCNVCGTTTEHSVTVKKDQFGEHVTIIKCSVCGIVTRDNTQPVDHISVY